MPSSPCPPGLLRLQPTEESFLQDLLRDTLDWPLPSGSIAFDDVAFRWSLEELQLEKFGVRLRDPEALQLASLVPGMPFGVFILKVNDDINLDSRLGIRMVIRRLLRSLRASDRRPAHLPSWRDEDMLLIFTREWHSYSFVLYDPDPLGDRKSVFPKFSWHLHQRREYVWHDHLRHLSWPEELKQWKARWRPGFHTYLEKTSISPRREPTSGSPRRRRRREHDPLRDAIFATDSRLASDISIEDPDLWELAQSILTADASRGESDDPSDWVSWVTDREVILPIRHRRADAPSGSALAQAALLTKRREAARRLLLGHISEERMMRDLAIVFGESDWSEADYVSFPTAVHGVTDETALRRWELTGPAIEDIGRHFPNLASRAVEWWASPLESESLQ